MRTYELYFSGPSTHDEKIPDAPKPEEMYCDFIQLVYSSGYKLKSSSMKYRKNFVTIEVIGVK